MGECVIEKGIPCIPALSITDPYFAEVKDMDEDGYVCGPEAGSGLIEVKRNNIESLGMPGLFYLSNFENSIHRPR